MLRKLFAATFVLVLACLTPVTVANHAAALQSAVASPLHLAPAFSPLHPPTTGRSCTQHVCNICAQSGLACDPVPYCHCD